MYSYNELFAINQQCTDIWNNMDNIGNIIECRHKRPHLVWYNYYEMSRI
jgi:hypothetical protein